MTSSDSSVRLRHAPRMRPFGKAVGVVAVVSFAAAGKALAVGDVLPAAGFAAAGLLFLNFVDAALREVSA